MNPLERPDRCGLCFFHDGYNCHKRAPTVHFIGNDDFPRPVWPATTIYHWCGDFRAREQP